MVDDTPSNIFSNLDIIKKYKLEPPPISSFFIELLERVEGDLTIPTKFNDGIDILCDILNDKYKM